MDSMQEGFLCKAKIAANDSTRSIEYEAFRWRMGVQQAARRGVLRALRIGPTATDENRAVQIARSDSST